MFIIDGKGTIRQITINDLPIGRSVDETLRLVQALQYTDEHGEVIKLIENSGTRNCDRILDVSLLHTSNDCCTNNELGSKTMQKK